MNRLWEEKGEGVDMGAAWVKVFPHQIIRDFAPVCVNFGDKIVIFSLKNQIFRRIYGFFVENKSCHDNFPAPAGPSVMTGFFAAPAIGCHDRIFRGRVWLAALPDFSAWQQLCCWHACSSLGRRVREEGGVEPPPP